MVLIRPCKCAIRRSSSKNCQPRRSFVNWAVSPPLRRHHRPPRNHRHRPPLLVRLCTLQCYPLHCCSFFELRWHVMWMCRCSSGVSISAVHCAIGECHCHIGRYVFCRTQQVFCLWWYSCGVVACNMTGQHDRMFLCGLRW